MNDRELEFKRWMADFGTHETFRTIKDAPLQCMVNEFVFYYNPNSEIEEHAGKFYITNKRVVFDIPERGVTEVALSDIDVAYRGLDEIEISQGTATVHVSGNGNIMYTLIGLLKRIDGAKYVRQGYDTINHMKEECDCVKRAVLDGVVSDEMGDIC